MADSLPSPPISRESTPLDQLNATHNNDLVQQLDDLLEQYLESLDAYTALREELAKTFSNGFMSLAHAQRTSTLGPGRRYGQDGYDGRMKASRRVCIEQSHSSHDVQESRMASTKSNKVTDDEESSPECNLRVVTRVPETRTSNADGQQEQEKQQQNSRPRKRSVQEILEAAASNPVDEPDKDANQGRRKSKVDPAYRDPVTWFGFFVPLYLRQTQQAFSKSLEGTIPNLVNTANQLRSLEAKIVSLRADLGIATQDVENDISLSLRPTKGGATALPA